MTDLNTFDSGMGRSGKEQSKRPSVSVDPALAAAVGGAVGIALLTWLLSRFRLRRAQPKTPSEKLVQAGRDASTALGHYASRLASDAAEAAQKGVAVATPVVVTGAGVLAHEAKKAGSRATQAGTQAAMASAQASHDMAETLEQTQRRVSRFFTRLLATLAFGGGYVLGAQAGRERYDQLVRAVDQVRARVTS